MKGPIYQRGDRRRSSPIRRLARALAGMTFGVVDRLVPKKPRRIVLGADKGLKYTGNPRALFEWMATESGWEPYWLTASDEIAGEVDRLFPGRAIRSWSLRGVWLGLTARFLAVSHSPYDLGPFAFLRRARFLYLNHGTPLKTMGYLKHYDDSGVDDQARSFAAIACCSSFEGKLWRRAYRVPKRRIWVTGVPRNDRLFVPSPDAPALSELKPTGKMVLFAPTYRESGVLDGYLPVPGLGRDRLIDVLERHDATLLIRPHYYESAAAGDTIARLGSNRIVAADEDRVPDVTDLLPAVDVLVTDYSSIYVDFLLLDRPIIFVCHDLEQYARERGFMIDYLKYTPGAKARTPSEFLAVLETELAGDDPFRDARAAMRRLFHTHADGRSAARIAARIAVA